MKGRLAIPADVPRGPDHLWSLVQAAGERGVTIPELVAGSNGVAYKTAQGLVRCWLDAGALVRIGTSPARRSGSREAVRYALVQGVRERPIRRRPDFEGRRGRAQHDLWTAMRQLREGFRIEELALAASSLDFEIGERTAEIYVRRLIKAGLVVATRPYSRAQAGRNGAAAGVYRLKPSANTGPRPLSVMQTGWVFDPNTNRVVGSTATAEVSA